MIRKYKVHYRGVRGDALQPPHGTNTRCREDKLIPKGVILESNDHTHKKIKAAEVPNFLGQAILTGACTILIQLTLVISTSLISNNRISRSENLVPA